jgi:hypothetical protein
MDKDTSTSHLASLAVSPPSQQVSQLVLLVTLVSAQTLSKTLSSWE